MKMTLEVPSWINIDFFNKVLREYYKDETISIEDLLVKPATNKGDNYSSEMHRAIMEYTRNQSGGKTRDKISLIVKVTPTNEIVGELIQKIGVFHTEILMMSDTLVKMNRLLGSGTTLGARCFYSQTEQPSFIVCEDLAPRGFRMANRETGLDLPHALLAIRGMAKFHASSVALLEKDSDAFKEYTKSIFHKDQPAETTHFFVAGIKALGEEVASWPELGSEYSEKIIKLSSKAFEKACEAAKINKDDFNVLNHGDFWVNNMLFRYDDEGNPIDHIFVDFQMCVYTSPAVDLLYFLNTSLSNEVQLNDHELLLVEYHSTLAATMIQLNCETPAPTLEELKKAMKDREFYGLISSFTILPIVLAAKSEVMNVDDMLRELETYKNPAYKGEAYRKVMLQILPYYNKMGLLDI